MEDYTWDHDMPLPSVESNSVEGGIYQETDYRKLSSQLNPRPGSESPIFVNPDQLQIYPNDTGISPESISYSVSDTDSTFSSSDGSEIDHITVVNERYLDDMDGKKRQYLVKCWVDEKHMGLLTELLKIQYDSSGINGLIGL